MLLSSERRICAMWPCSRRMAIASASRWASSHETKSSICVTRDEANWGPTMSTGKLTWRRASRSYPWAAR